MIIAAGLKAVELRREAPVPVNWPARVAAVLDGMVEAGFTPLEDLVLMERAFLGAGFVGREMMRVRGLMTAARDDHGHVSLQGQTALMAELREWAKAWASAAK